MRRFLISLTFLLIVCLAGSAEARKLALLVGVDEYDDVPSLKCCVNDMNTLKEALMKIGFEEDDIQVLVTGGAGRAFPTKKKIERRISELISDAGPTDLVFLAFSGHGAQEGQTVYFCPPDVDPEDLEGTCVSITKVMDDLGRCNARFKWMVVDACRNNPTNSRDARAFQVIPKAPAGIVLFQSCAEGQKSCEEARPGGNGYFMKNFAAAISGEADSDYDGKLTLLEVCDWTTAQTEAEVKNAENKIQRPFLNGKPADFTLTEDQNVPKAKELAAEAQKAMEEDNYELAIEKFDAALELCPQFEDWKSERDLAKRIIKHLPPKYTSRDSFEWNGTTIKKFIGKETKVVIPKGVTKIGSRAFKDCSSLTSVVIPEGVTVIGAMAFEGCSSLTSVEIPKGITEIGNGVFWGCSSLTSVVIPEGVTVIDAAAFCDCTSLTSVVIPKSVTEIGMQAFLKCSSLTSVVIPEGVTVIEEDAFSDCSSLKSVVIPKSVKFIYDGFQNCRSLASVEIPEGVTVINYGSFSGCSSLTSVVIPEGMTEIGNGVFWGCSSLTSIVIPDSVKEIGPGAFAGCTALKEWPISSTHPYFKRDGVGLLTKDGKKLVACLASAKEYRIPESVTEIGWNAFDGCSSLTSVVIPDSVKEIRGSSFRGCSSLKSVVIPEGVTEIRSWAFEGCSSLTSVEIPASVSKIGENAFEDCSKLTIYAPAGSEAEKYAKREGIPFKVKQ